MTFQIRPLLADWSVEGGNRADQFAAECEDDGQYAPPESSPDGLKSFLIFRLNFQHDGVGVKDRFLGLNGIYLMPGQMGDIGFVPVKPLILQIEV